jgi:hypothetical protein
VPRYRNYIMGDPKDVTAQRHPQVQPNAANVVGYWRLVDATSTAKDETGARDGTYKGGSPFSQRFPSATTPGSNSAPGTFIGGRPSLVASDQVARCRNFNGGYMVVKDSAGFYTDEFTIEAWVDSKGLLNAVGFRRMLLSAGGLFSAPAGQPPAFHGFKLFADGDRWQAQLFPQESAVFAPPLPIVSGGPTHVALTVGKADSIGVKRQVSLFVNGKLTVRSIVDLYSPSSGTDLYIGIDNSTPGQGPFTGDMPMLADIQEVVLHKAVLSQEEIENHATFV